MSINYERTGVDYEKLKNKLDGNIFSIFLFIFKIGGKVNYSLGICDTRVKR